MSNISTTRPAFVTDAPAPAGNASWSRDERTGALHMRAPLTWTGVREYPQIRVNGRAARILRRPEQVSRPGYLRTCERITPTHGHPRDDQGRQVLISADNYRRYAVGSVGDRIDMEVIDRYPVPVGNITVVDADTIAAIEAGDDQVSQGFFALIAPPPDDETAEDGSGVWQGPNGPEPYDAEHVCDPDHPAALAYEQENPEFPRRKIGANHIAVGIPHGRGLAQAQARPLESYDSAALDSGVVLFLDESPQPNRAEMRKHVKRKISWSPKLPKGLNLGIAVPCLDEMEVEPAEGSDSPEMLMEFFNGLQSLISALLEKAAAAEGAAEAASGEAAAMADKVGAAEGVAAAAVEAADSLTKERDALLAEVGPLRKAAVTSAKGIAAKAVPGVVLDACEDLAAVRRAAVIAKLPTLAESSDAVIEGAWSVLVAGLDSVDPPDTNTGTGTNTPSEQFMQGADSGEAPPANKARKMFAVVGQ